MIPKIFTSIKVNDRPNLDSKIVGSEITSGLNQIQNEVYPEIRFEV